jgi:hypothetical protein
MDSQGKYCTIYPQSITDSGIPGEDEYEEEEIVDMDLLGDMVEFDKQTRQHMSCGHSFPKAPPNTPGR